MLEKESHTTYICLFLQGNFLSGIHGLTPPPSSSFCQVIQVHLSVCLRVPSEWYTWVNLLCSQFLLLSRWARGQLCSFLPYLRTSTPIGLHVYDNFVDSIATTLRLRVTHSMLKISLYFHDCGPLTGGWSLLSITFTRKIPPTLRINF